MTSIRMIDPQLVVEASHGRTRLMRAKGAYGHACFTMALALVNGSIDALDSIYSNEETGMPPEIVATVKSFLAEVETTKKWINDEIESNYGRSRDLESRSGSVFGH